MILLVLACAGPSIPLDGDTAAPPDADTDSDADTDTDTDTALPVVAEGLALTVHPEVSTILVARWTQLAAGDTWLSWDVDGETFTAPVRAREAGAASEVVLGLPATTAVTVTLHTDGAPLTATEATGALPDELVTPTLTLWDPLGADDARWFLTSVDSGPNNFFGPCSVVILDRAGRVVWYREVSDRRLTLFPRVAQAGTHILWDATTYYVADAIVGGVTRATLSLGQTVETPIDGIGMTFDELPDGSLLFDHAESGYAYHLERLHPDGTRERIWSCAPWMDAYDDSYWACAPNAVRWDPASGVVVWSMFQTSTVVGIDLETGELAWELGEYPGGYTFDPPDIRLELQHFPHFTTAGTLLLTAHVPGEPGVQRVRELELDPGAGVARQVWTYQADGYYGRYMGEATRLPNGNTLVSFGTDGVVREVTPDADVVWELDWDDHMPGHFTPLDDLYALDEGW